MPGDDTRPYEEWHHDSALHGEPGGWDAPQELEPPREWYGAGTFVPGNDGQPTWDDPFQDQLRGMTRTIPSPTARRPAAGPGALPAIGHDRGAAAGRFRGRPGAALLRNGTIHLSPATSPRATATSGLGAKTATGHGSNGIACLRSPRRLPRRRPSASCPATGR